MIKQLQAIHQQASFFNALLKKYHQKVELIEVNISASFIARARCKYCGTPPSLYLYSRNPYLYADIGQKQFTSAFAKKWIKRICGDWYLQEEPSSFTEVNSFQTIYRDYFTPTLQRTRGNPSDRDNLMEMICCECGKTAWHFKNKSIKNKPEIINRKGKYNYPQKFSW